MLINEPKTMNLSKSQIKQISQSNKDTSQRLLGGIQMLPVKEQSQAAIDFHHVLEHKIDVDDKTLEIQNGTINKNNNNKQESDVTLKEQASMQDNANSHALERLRMVISHLIQKNQGRPIALRLSAIQITDSGNYQDLLSKINESDLLLINQHQNLLINLWTTFHNLIKIPQYQIYQSTNFKEIVKEIYILIDNDVDFVKLLMTLFKRRNIFFKEGNINENPFISHLIKDTQKLMLQNNLNTVAQQFFIEPQLKCITEEKQKIETRNQTENETQKMFNSRVTRTIQYLVKKGFTNDKKSEEIVKDLAVFLIKLTDKHVEQILNKAISLAEVTGKPTQNKLIPYNEYGFKPKIIPYIQQTQSQPLQTKLYKLSYKNPMSIYKEFRINEYKKQTQLSQQLQPQIVFNNIRTGSHATKLQKAMHDYYHTTTSKQTKDEFEQIQTENTILPKKIALQPKHLKQILQNHPFYRTHLITWRVSTLY